MNVCGDTLCAVSDVPYALLYVDSAGTETEVLFRTQHGRVNSNSASIDKSSRTGDKDTAREGASCPAD